MRDEYAATLRNKQGSALTEDAKSDREMVSETGRRAKDGKG